MHKICMTAEHLSNITNILYSFETTGISEMVLTVELKNDIKEWCDNSLSFPVNIELENANMYIIFGSDTDLILFKLQWM